MLPPKSHLEQDQPPAENATDSRVDPRREEFNDDVCRPLDDKRAVLMATRGRHKEKAIPSLEVWPSVPGVRPWEAAFREASPGWPPSANATSASCTPRITDSEH